MNARLKVPTAGLASGLTLPLAVLMLYGCGTDAPGSESPAGGTAVSTEESLSPQTSDASTATPQVSAPQTSDVPRPAPPAPAPRTSTSQSTTAARPEVVSRPETTPTADEAVYVPAGSLIPVVLEEGLSTRTNQAGDVFHATVVDEILAADGMILIPEGARLEGMVAESRRSESADQEALLVLTFEALLLEGRRIPIDAVVTEAQIETSAQDSDTRTAAKVATGAAAGAIVGQILGRDTRATIQGAVVGAVAGTGVALATRDGHATISEGSQIMVRLESPAHLNQEGL